jgi:hypothetical protein
VLAGVAVDADLTVILRLVVLTARCLILYRVLQLLQSAEGVGREVDAAALDFRWL